MDPHSDINQIIEDKISAFKGTTNSDGTYKDRIYQSARSSSIQISTDYGRRYLVELIQNGYDAHPSYENDGQVKILFAPDEGEYGVLYVGNKGNEFNYSNLKALSDIGLSDKPIGESIGNKGLGFRSVRHVSDRPEIYSCKQGSIGEGYNGYCFRFASQEDFIEWIAEPNILKLAQKDIPPFHIPVYLENIPNNLSYFKEDGFVTVIRLALRDEIAKKSVYDEIEKIKDSKAPLLLFLRRLSLLEVIITDDEESSFKLKRSQKQLAGSKEENFEVCQITLDDKDNYLVAWKWISEGVVKKHISESINSKDLHESWHDWHGKGEVALAVRLDNEKLKPLLYTYLPMGSDATAPIRGFLHGSFYPKSDRTSLRADIPLNKLYIIEAIKLSAKTIKLLVDSSKKKSSLISDEIIGNVIIDLISWRDVGSIDWNGNASIPDHVNTLFEGEGLPVRSSEVFPIYPCADGKKWGAIEKICRWDSFDNLRVLRAEELARSANIQVLHSSIDPQRVNLFDDFINEFDDGYGLTADTGELANAIGLIAQKLHKKKYSAKSWQEFYLDVTHVLERIGNLDLTQREFLLCNDKQLRGPSRLDENLSKADSAYQQNKKGRRRKALQVEIFSPGQRLSGDSKEGEESIFRIPKVLSKGFAFLDEHLDWGGVLEHSRKKFEEKKIIQKYDAEEIVAQISRIVVSKSNQKVRSAALRWVFRLYCATSDKPSILRRANLYVPTRKDEWIPAEEAIFSEGWPQKTLGEISSEFLSHAQAHADDLRGLHYSLIAAPSSPPFSDKNIVLWTEFLSAIGVHKGLKPTKLDKSRFRIDGRKINAKNICEILRIGENVQNLWEKEAQVSGEGYKYKNSNHTVDGDFWYLPGQNEHDSFSAPTKQLYAELLLNWLRDADDNYFNLVFYTSNYRSASRFNWPTPLAAFLRQAEWLPMENKENDGEQNSFCSPSHTWLTDEKSERLPYFLPQFHLRIKRLVGDPEISNKLSRLCGARVLNENYKETLIYQIEYLGQLWARGIIDRFFQKDFINLYYGSWQKLMSFCDEVDWQEQPLSCVIVEQKNSYSSIFINSEGLYEEELYVQDSESSLRAKLLLSLSKSIFDPGVTSVKKLGLLLSDLLGESYRSINELEVSFTLDEEEWCAGNVNDKLLVDNFPWISQILCLAIESLTGTAARRIPANRTVIFDRLNRTKCRVVNKIKVTIGDSCLPLPYDLYGVLGIKDKENPVLIVQLVEGDHGTISWSAFARASNAISEVLEIPDVFNALTLIFRNLERLNVPLSIDLRIEDLIDDLCPDLYLNPKQARDVIKFVENDKAKSAKFIRPVVHYFLGLDKVKLFNKAVTKAETTWELTDFLRTHLGADDVDVEYLIRISLRAFDFIEIRNAFNLDFEKFNISLMDVGEEPDVYPELHKEAVDGYLKENKEVLIDRLRCHYLQEFCDGKSLEKYVLGKEELGSIKPDPNWLLKVYDPDEELILSLVNCWFSTRGIIDGAKNDLIPFRRAREENTKNLKAFIKLMSNLVRAWCRKNNSTLPPIWDDPLECDKLLVGSFDNAGFLDFDLLSNEAFYIRICLLGHWPSGMPKTEDLIELGLSMEHIESERKNESKAKEQYKKTKRSVEINGKLIDPLEISPEDAAEEIFSKINSKALNTKLTHALDLQAATKPCSGGSPPVGSSGGKRKGGGHLNSDRNEFVGFLGECAVYHWLKKLLPKQDIDSTWVSENRSKLLATSGNDSLGYDFVIKYKKQTWYLEVKTSVGDPQMFNMGETEVRFATICANQKGCDYKIIYVSSIDDSSKTSIEILPNPMARNGGKGYQIGGQGFRLSFKRK